MGKIESYRDLEAWQSAIELSLEVFAVASQLPGSERFELGSQMRRAGVSVPSNVAEGQASGPGRRYLHHVEIALGSLAELDTHVEIVRRRQLVSQSGLAAVEELLQRTETDPWTPTFAPPPATDSNWRSSPHGGCLVQRRARVVVISRGRSLSFRFFTESNGRPLSMPRTQQPAARREPRPLYW